MSDDQTSGWTGEEVAMIYDETGNAIDCFDYTATELRRRADMLDGRAIVTLNPSSFASLDSTT